MGFDHIRVCTKNCEEGPTDTVERLAKFATIVASGKLCPSIGTWFASAPLLPLIKDDDVARPIAVGDTLRRLVGKQLMLRVKKAAVDLLYPIKLGI